MAIAQKSYASGFCLALRPAPRYGAGMTEDGLSNTAGKGKVAVVIVAAGRGERAGQSADGPKQYRPISGRAVIARTLEAFASHPAIGPIAVAIHPDDDALFSNAAGALAERAVAIHGGATRQASTRLGLQALAEKGSDWVMIHDGVRPFVDAGLIDGVIGALAPGRGAIPALPVSDTLKRAGADGVIEATVSRNGLYAAQTPQAFPFKAIFDAHLAAHRAGLEDFTDDAAIAEWAGIPVKLVEGSADNVKITFARDIELANQRFGNAAARSLPDVRTGNGYDVHGFAAGDSVTLCGVSIPHDRRLSGHSDADVGLHALTDALLATCGAGDIGVHFPPSDPKWHGVASRVFLGHAARLVADKGGRIANVDVTLICEAPRIAPHREEMVTGLAGMLGLSVDRVSVKATTNEKLGFVGRREGIAAIATATVVYPGAL
jgi:2-C-methyl-D-erythritol 4-phosphate cytidylyltransferase/2-C-methyl-D-erythritol 2,4-cyclodiphosphate synthase